MTNPSRGRGILVSHKPTRTQPTNEFYRLTAGEGKRGSGRAKERGNGRAFYRSGVLSFYRFPPAIGGPSECHAPPTQTQTTPNPL